MSASYIMLDTLRDITADVCAIKDHLLTEQPTWLDRCAWAAMQGICASPACSDANPTYENVAAKAYAQAQAMLEEKLKREGAR